MHARYRSPGAETGLRLPALLLGVALVAGLAAGLGWQGLAPERAAAEYELTTPPKTKIQAAPPRVVRTHRARTRVGFRFRANDPRARFQCRLRGAGGRAARLHRCASPQRYRVRATREPRRHRFEVRAVNRVGVAERRPARYDFRVVRRR